MDKPGQKLLLGGGYAAHCKQPKQALAVAGALAAGLLGLRVIGGLCARIRGRQVWGHWLATAVVPARCLTTGAARRPPGCLVVANSTEIIRLAPYNRRVSVACGGRSSSGSSVRAGAAASLSTARHPLPHRHHPSPAAAAAPQRASSTSMPTAVEILSQLPARPPSGRSRGLPTQSSRALPPCQSGRRPQAHAASSASMRSRPSSGGTGTLSPLQPFACEGVQEAATRVTLACAR